MLNLADGLTISIPKMFASAQVEYGSTSATYRDKYGWAGDLARLYSQWRLEASQYGSGTEFVDQNFARVDVDSCFSFPDYIADAIGYLLHRGTNTSDGWRYDEVLESLYSLSIVDYCQQLFAMRWGASHNDLRGSAEAWLDDLLSSGSDEWRREFLLRFGDSPGEIDSPPVAEVENFLDGFAQRVLDLTDGDF